MFRSLSALRTAPPTMYAPPPLLFRLYANPPLQGFDADLLTKHLHLDSASADGTTTFTFTVPAEYCNCIGNLHGGAAALLLDICTTTALVSISRPGYWQSGGLSASLNITYVRPVPCGTRVEIVSSVVSAGRRLAFLKGKIRLDGKALVAAQHTKVRPILPICCLGRGGGVRLC